MNEDTPAFPRPSACTDWENHNGQEGMTLREWYAGQALALLRRPSNQDTLDITQDLAAKAAKCAFLIADAMVAESHNAPKTTDQ